MIRAVIFDFDGLIVDTESVWFEVYRHLLEQHGVELTIEKFAECVGTTNEALYLFYEQETGEPLDVKLFQQNARVHFDTQMNEPIIREGVIDYLTEAKQAGLCIGLATSSHLAWVEKFLKQFNLYDFFEVLVTRDDVEKVKPDPALYILAVDRLGIAADEAVAFEDSAHGAVAAISAGLHCVVVPNMITHHLDFPQNTLRIPSMASCGLSDMIKRVEGRN